MSGSITSLVVSPSRASAPVVSFAGGGAADNWLPLFPFFFAASLIVKARFSTAFFFFLLFFSFFLASQLCHHPHQVVSTRHIRVPYMIREKTNIAKQIFFSFSF